MEELMIPGLTPIRWGQTFNHFVDSDGNSRSWSEGSLNKPENDAYLLRTGRKEIVQREGAEQAIYEYAWFRSAGFDRNTKTQKYQQISPETFWGMFWGENGDFCYLEETPLESR